VRRHTNNNNNNNKNTASYPANTLPPPFARTLPGASALLCFACHPFYSTAHASTETHTANTTPKPPNGRTRTYRHQPVVVDCPILLL
jgi:hypothetical protein